MSFPDLLYRIAHSYVGKVPALAARMGKNPTVLMHKLNPNKGSHGLNADEAELMIDFAEANEDVARYFADKANMLLIPKIMVDGSDMQMLDGFMDVVRELGEFSTTFQKDYADGRISADDYRDICKEGNDVIVKMASFLDRIGQMVEPDD